MTPSPNRWVQLAVSIFGQVTGTAYASGTVFLLPYLTEQRGLPLVAAGAVVAMPTIATVLTLFAWGVYVDRFGERASMTAGLVGVVGAALGAAASSGSVAVLAVSFFFAGLGVASGNSASGRIVVGWFPSRRRGVAMGVRQAAIPIGAALGAGILPNVTAAWGLAAAMLILAGLNAIALALAVLVIVDPPRPEREVVARDGLGVNPYRRGSGLIRVHLASALLVVPQMTVGTFMLVWLNVEKQWALSTASALVVVSWILGAAGRVGAGVWSDRVGSRLGPMRIVAVTASATMLGLGALETTPLGAMLMVAASVITVMDNGLAFTTVAESAGPLWAGRALGIHNTGQFALGAGVPVGVGFLITQFGYPPAFFVVALCALTAVPLIPVRAGSVLGDR